MIETIGLILGVFGLLFAFETPRNAFLRLIRFKKKTELRHEIAIVSGPRVDEGLNAVLQNNKITESKSLAIEPQDIIAKEEHLSALEFDGYFKSFTGHTVTWEGKIGTVTSMKGGQEVRIQIVFKKMLRGFFDVKIIDFPNVKLFRSGDIAIVTGEIGSPDWPTFNIMNPKVLKWTKK